MIGASLALSSSSLNHDVHCGDPICGYDFERLRILYQHLWVASLFFSQAKARTIWNSQIPKPKHVKRGHILPLLQINRCKYLLYLPHKAHASFFIPSKGSR